MYVLYIYMHSSICMLTFMSALHADIWYMVACTFNICSSYICYKWLLAWYTNSPDGCLCNLQMEQTLEWVLQIVRIFAKVSCRWYRRVLMCPKMVQMVAMCLSDGSNVC
jgi:hypothetical protein